MKFWSVLVMVLITLPMVLKGQEDLLALLEEEKPDRELVTASFKTNRVINLHSLKNTPRGVLDFKIGHRFGFINQGISEFFGLDNATIRLGLEMGLTDRLAVGLGRSSFEKTIDGFAKFKLLRQSRGTKAVPVTAALLAGTAIKTAPFEDPDRENFLRSKLFYTFQLIIGRKFSEEFSLQMSPTLIHRNLVSSASENNDVFALGIGARQKLNKRFSLNVEYIYTLPGQLADPYKNALSIGFDIETGGHVFQLHFTNSTSMIEKGFIAETQGDWMDGDIHFGFNISRVFTLY